MEEAAWKTARLAPRRSPLPRAIEQAGRQPPKAGAGIYRGEPGPIDVRHEHFCVAVAERRMENISDPAPF